LLEGTIQTLAKPCAVIARSTPEYLGDDGRENLGADLRHLNRSPRDRSGLGGDPFLETPVHAKKQPEPDINDIDDQVHMDVDGPGHDDKVAAMKTEKAKAKLDIDDELEDELVLEQPWQNPNDKEVPYDIITIVRKKIVFAKRPIPIVPSSLKGIGSITVNPTSSSAGAGVGAGGADD
jgi:hypothetical protein